MENKQTAVEWLEKQLDSTQLYWLKDWIEQAKEMEKRQIIEAYEYTAAGTSHYGEEYYNNTFKSE